MKKYGDEFMPVEKENRRFISLKRRLIQILIKSSFFLRYG